MVIYKACEGFKYVFYVDLQMKKLVGIAALCVGLLQGCAHVETKTTQHRCIEQLAHTLQKATPDDKYSMIIEMKGVSEVLDSCGYGIANKQEKRTAINAAVYLTYPEINKLESIKVKLEDASTTEQITLRKNALMLINSLKQKGFDVGNYHNHAIKYGQESGLLDKDGNPIEQIRL
jgi:uncharacterized SAM-dependent methyltransferase